MKARKIELQEREDELRALTDMYERASHDQAELQKTVDQLQAIVQKAEKDINDQGAKLQRARTQSTRLKSDYMAARAGDNVVNIEHQLELARSRNNSVMKLLGAAAAATQDPAVAAFIESLCQEFGLRPPSFEMSRPGSGRSDASSSFSRPNSRPSSSNTRPNSSNARPASSGIRPSSSGRQMSMSSRPVSGTATGRPVSRGGRVGRPPVRPSSGPQARPLSSGGLVINQGGLNAL
eukprot:TRINITY_DN3710_c0_g1_i1.p1 TRINITY_DN3710_c0_g1~~TRINITY_DN3710_c0_g1_i1.p1  ORF type:complete len:236 (-),score=30.10 TRINITY_DN3710_c0_g1_i1:33-740(-)